MTNFEKYISDLTQDKFIDSMILNCDGCPVYSCCGDSNSTEVNGIDCEERLRNWCEGENQVLGGK